MGKDDKELRKLEKRVEYTRSSVIPIPCSPVLVDFREHEEPPKEGKWHNFLALLTPLLIILIILFIIIYF